MIYETKVLKYKFDGNTVVAPYMELEAYAENVYLSLSKKNKYGNDHEDIFHVVCKIENVYFSYGQYSRRILGNEEHKKKIVGYCKNWIADTLRDAENENIFPFCLSVFLKNSDLTRLRCCKPVKRT